MSKITECGCEASMAPEIAPVAINIAPAPDVEQQAALLSPKPVVPSIPAKNVYVYFKDATLLDESDGSDILYYILNFNVSIYDDVTKSSHSFVVPKKISLSKRRMMIDAENAINSISTTVVEEKPTKKSEAVRMRELAGIPHSKNHV